MRRALLAAGVAAAAVVAAVPAKTAGTLVSADMLAQAAAPPASKPGEQRNGDASKPQGEEQPREPSAAAPQPRPKPRAVPPRRDAKIDTPECTWVGKRTIRVLMRDDLIAAEGFLRFYNAFGCPVRHLGQAFGCSLGTPEGAPAKTVETRIEACWQDPTAKPETAEAPPAAPQQPTQKPGSPPAKPAPNASKAPAPPAAKPKEPETSYPKR